MNTKLKIYSIFLTINCILGLEIKKKSTGSDFLTINEIVTSVNSDKSALWKADKNFFKSDENLSKYSYLTGTYLGKHPDGYDLDTKTGKSFANYTVPKYFDPSEKWPECSHSLKLIRDQGSCGSCWAFGAAEAMSDRTCIASKGNFKGDISSEDILACCGFICGNGCNGGWPMMAWRYFKYFGVVTGGLYGDTKSGCLPYVIEPCEHHTTGNRPSCDGEEGKTPKCPKKCIEESGLDWRTDKHYAVDAYKVENNEETIMKELYEHGPAEVAISVYEDFAAYKSGIYHHVSGKFLGGHAIRLVGWGQETINNKVVKYWILANSWNSDWGENGFFRMLRGVNECGVEGEVVAGIAKAYTKNQPRHKLFAEDWQNMFDNGNNIL